MTPRRPPADCWQPWSEASLADQRRERRAHLVAANGCARVSGFDLEEPKPV
jgi:hypothetical protein